MTVQNKRFDKAEFIDQFSGALNQIEKAGKFGKSFAGEGINFVITARSKKL